MERNFGYAIARAYAGHTDRRGPATTTYIKSGPARHRRRGRSHDRPTPPARRLHHYTREVGAGRAGASG